MKKIVFSLVLMVVFIGCDDRLNFINEYNLNPEIFIVVNGNDLTELTDSVKMSLKSTKEEAELVLRVFDPEGLLNNVKATIIEGNGTFFQNDAPANTDNLIIDNGNVFVKFKPSNPGNHRISFTAYDNLNKSKTVIVRIFAFVNLPPIAVRNITAYKVNHPLEYILDATGSKDPDKNQGGNILIYEWNINGNILTSTQRQSFFVFPSAGTYDIRLRVMDNDGEYSSIVGGVLNIN